MKFCFHLLIVFARSVLKPNISNQYPMAPSPPTVSRILNFRDWHVWDQFSCRREGWETKKCSAKKKKNVAQVRRGTKLAQWYLGFTLSYLGPQVLRLWNTIPNWFQYVSIWGLSRYSFIHFLRQALTSYVFIPFVFVVYCG